MSIRLLVTGRTGQVSRALQALSGGAVEVLALGREQLDLLQPQGFRQILRERTPDVVASVGAYTGVDRAEADEHGAHQVNAAGPAALAAACAALDVPIIHLSTDYVFDGAKHGAYRESDATGPKSVYGRTKLAGEQGVAAAGGQHIILRTAWLYDSRGSNFVTTMLRLAATRRAIPVVDDQRGCPTPASFVANAVLRFAHALGNEGAAAPGVYHVACAGACTRWEFATAIFEGARARGGPSAQAQPVSSAAYPTAAKRPANSELACEKYAALFGAPPPWRAELERCLDEIAAAGWPLT